MQQGGGSPFRGPPPPELEPAFVAAAPISIRQPPAGSAAKEEPEIAASESGGVPGNRWPRQETVALLKIRSDMDAAFQDATLKGPLWEEVSRKLGELGYNRSAKKCKEKFENVHKYYKRTKEGRAGRQDGKSYRFFSQLEALHSSASSAAVAVAAGDPAPLTMTGGTATSLSIPGTLGTSSRPQPLQFPAAIAQVAAPALPPMAASGLSFSSNTSSYTGTESDDEEEGEEGRKRKRDGGGGGEAAKGSRKMVVLFERMMRQVMERHEAMQKRFLEAIERREQDRMIREEAWRRQEMSRISREHELAAQERAAAAARDAAIIGFLQKLTGQTISFPPPPPPPPSPPIPPAVTIPDKLQPPMQQAPPPPTTAEIVAITPAPPPPAQLPAEAQPGPPAAVPSRIMEAPSSRWPKSEVQALIKLRSGMEAQYHDSGPKGPLWEEISAGMRQLGYNRSSKRCKEKWENINKYFKKVKESNKKRQEDTKTCPYFHQLDALYRNKLHSGSVVGGDVPEPKPSSQLAQPQPPPAGFKNNETGGKPEDIVKELMEQPLMDNLEDDVACGDEDDEDEEEEAGDMQYKIQFQRPRVGGSDAGADGPAEEGNFLAMVR